MQNYFNAVGIAPAIVGQPAFYKHRGKIFAVIIMEQIDGVLDTLLEQNLKPIALQDILFGLLRLINTMNREGLMHRDMHPGNISFTYKKKR